jgi:hypothetical protein
MLATQFEAWREQWLAEGFAKGFAEAFAKAFAEAFEESCAERFVKGWGEALICLLAGRFGRVAPSWQKRIRGANLATLERWFKRAIAAPDLLSVFNPPRLDKVTLPKARKSLGGRHAVAGTAHDRALREVRQPHFRSPSRRSASASPRRTR